MTYPKGWGARRSWPLPERPQGAPQAPEYFFFKQWIKRLLGRKMYIKVSFMYPRLSEGPLMTQWAPAVIRGPLVSWAPSHQGAPGNLGAPSRAGGSLLREILGTCLTKCHVKRTKVHICSYYEVLHCVKQSLVSPRSLITLSSPVFPMSAVVPLPYNSPVRP